MANQNKTNTMILGGLFVLMVVIVYAVFFRAPAVASVGSNGNPQNVIPGAGYACAASGVATNTIQLMARNTLDSTGSRYGAVSLAVTDANGKIVGTGTGTAATTPTYVSVTVPCGPNYQPPARAYALSSTSLSYGSGGVVDLDSSHAQYEIPTSNSSDAQLFFATSLGGNNTDGFYASPSAIQNTSVHAMTAGDSYSGTLQITANATSSKIGATKTWIIGAGDTSIYGANDFSVQGGFVKEACPSWATALSGFSCYSRTPVKSSEGAVNIPYTVHATGEPTTATAYVMYVCGDGYFGDTNGIVTLGAYNSGNTVQVYRCGKGTYQTS